jgi:hypothetical protein
MESLRKRRTNRVVRRAGIQIIRGHVTIDTRHTGSVHHLKDPIRRRVMRILFVTGQAELAFLTGQYRNPRACQGRIPATDEGSRFATRFRSGIFCQERFGDGGAAMARAAHHALKGRNCDRVDHGAEAEHSWHGCAGLERRVAGCAESIVVLAVWPGGLCPAVIDRRT